MFRRLSACHNVLFTGHRAFLTAEALISISETTLGNLQQLEKGEACPNELAYATPGGRLSLTRRVCSQLRCAMRHQSRTAASAIALRTLNAVANE